MSQVTNKYIVNNKIVDVVRDGLRYSYKLRKSECIFCSNSLFESDNFTEKSCKYVPLDPEAWNYQSQLDRRNLEGYPPMHVLQCNTCGQMNGPWVPASFYGG